MKLVEPSVEEIKIDDTIDMIAKVARNCYLSTPKEPDEAPFVSRLINNCHFAMVEHKALTFVVNKELYYEIKNKPRSEAYFLYDLFILHNIDPFHQEVFFQTDIFPKLCSSYDWQPLFYILSCCVTLLAE